MARIEYLINNPTEVTSDDLNLLNSEIEKYPYFYSLRALKLRALKNSNDSSFDENLQIAAVLSSNRKDLFNFVNNINVQNPISNEVNSVTELDLMPEVEVVDQIIDNDIIEEELTTEDLVAELDLTPEVEVVENIIDNNIIEEEITTEDLVAELELAPEVEIVDQIIDNNIIEEELTTEDLVAELELAPEVEVVDQIIDNNIIEEELTTEDLVAELEFAPEVEIVENIIDNNIIEEELTTEDLVAELEFAPEVEIVENIIDNNIIGEGLTTEDLVAELELAPEVEIADQIIDNYIIEEELIPESVQNQINLESSIENSLQIAEQFLQEDHEISNAVSETLDINTNVEHEPKIEQISLINRSATTETEIEKTSKPVSNINSFQVQNTYNEIKGAPAVIINKEIIEIEVIEDIIETEEIISEIETATAAEIQNTANVSEKIEHPQVSEDNIVEATQPTPIEKTNEIVDKPTEIIESKPTETEKEAVNKVDFIQTNDSFSFNDWLKLPSADTMETEKEQKYQIIDEFLEKNPKITPLKKQEIPEAKSEANKPTETDFSYLMTETLAQVYIDQKQYEKAIRAYKILSLKYPEKNSLFAKQIKEIENLKNSK
ncbi:hypothetical protein [Faecalibacter bovis]|uniref:Tetratricopeptide repeat protein n=1 Tax=Faecalibacter bovis TaxID=2898187 RepID=A0ABX7XEI1_9FLAO|nr:hypothetical protein [Faecalibacter bovis]QTV06219.1 hypothetical protein J9309_02490 [Faecalibacter bovis]